MAQSKAGFGTGAARAALGQGLMMGWGDEAEAWLREKMGDGSYAENVKKIRGEYGQFSQEHPVVSTLSEVAGAAAPIAGAMFLPGAQGVGATTGARALAKLAALGATEGAVSGAGSTEEGKRAQGAATGAVVGGATGVAAPVVLRGAGAGAKWLKDRLMPTEASVSSRAAEKMTEAMAQGKLTPQQMKARLIEDKGLRVPSVVANASPALSELAEAVAQRTGAGARHVEETLMRQKAGARERTYGQVQKALNPGEYYDDMIALQKEMRERAEPLYDSAYAFGEVTDPKVLKFLELPQFQQGLGEAKKLLAAEGREIDFSKPTVEVLDQVKRGLDTLIEKETDAITGKTTALGRVYVTKKNEFLKELDRAVPDYELARGVYAGGAETADAMRKGLNDFSKMDHEQVVKLIAKMSSGEKEAFRTGVARGLYGKIMDPSGNMNAAQRIIGSPETQLKLQPLFDSPKHYDLFKAAMERESQLFSQSNRILGGSQTAKRSQMGEALDADAGAGEAISRAVSGGFGGSLVHLVNKVVGNSKMPEKTAEKLSTMLMAKDPHEVAAVIKLLEDHAQTVAPKAFKAGVAEAGAVGGTTGAVWPSPPTGEAVPLVETYDETTAPVTGPDVEEYLKTMK